MKSRLLKLIFIFISLSFSAYAQNCTLNVSLSSSGTAICSGGSVVLTAAATGGTAPFTYVWSTGETTPSISINKGGTYTVAVSDKTPGCKPVTQSITVADAVVPDAPTAKSVVTCQNSSATLTATAPGGNYQWYDAPAGGNFLQSGNTYVTPPVAYSTIYYVQTTVGGCTSPRTPVAVYITGRPDVTGAIVCSGSPATLSADGGDTYTWYASASATTSVGTGPTFTTPALLSTKTYYVVAVTDGCTSAPTPVVAIVNPPPAAPVAKGMSVCYGSVASLHADAPAGAFDWFDVPVGGTSLISSPDYTTPPLTATKTYYVQNTLNDCQSARTPVTVIVNAIPAAPATQTVNTCSGTSAILTASANPSGTYQWFDAPADGRLLATGNRFTTPVLNAGVTYYVQVISTAGCTSDRAPVNVTITPPVPAPTASGLIICSGSAATLTASSTTLGTYQWYDAATGGTLVSSEAVFTTPALLNTKTYYVQVSLAGCVSPRTAVTVTVQPPVKAPVVPGATVCAGGAAVLTASGSGGSYAWYDAPTGGTLLSTGSTYATPDLTATTSYYVQSTVNDCTSPRTQVIVKVNAAPVKPTVSPVSVCSGTAASLTASAGAGNTIEWYDSPSEGILLATGSNYTTPVLSDNTSYYVQSRSGDCTSARVKVTVTINSVSGSQFLYALGTFGKTGPNPKPVIKNPAGGTFSASPAGLVFVDVHTGEINAAASVPGKYIVTLTSKGACSSTYSTDITISLIPVTKFFYNGPYCQYGTDPLPSFSQGASAGVFSATPAGLVFKNIISGEIDLSTSKPGTYIITNTINDAQGQPASSYSASVTINKAVIVNAGPDQVVKAGVPVQLNGSITGVSGGRWSGGLGKFSDPALLNAVYTPTPGERDVTLKLTSNDPPGVCSTGFDKMNITINAVPAAPTAPGTDVCMGSVATVYASAPGGTYKWYDAATDGNLLSTGANFITPPLTATTTYYVQTTINGITSPRTAVTILVRVTPAAPVVTALPACTGSVTTLTATGSEGTYKWYDAPAGGNLLSLSSTYVTPVLTANATYYVEAVVNDCESDRTRVDVQVNAVPQVTSPSANPICSGNPLNYTITADIPQATFLWSRADVTGISNTAAANQTSAIINETLLNTTGNPIDVMYVITPVLNNCSGTPFNYVVTVNPTPVVTSQPGTPLCYNTSSNYAVTFNTPVLGFNWSRVAVPGISNAPVSGQAATTIREVLHNTTNAPIDVPYVFNFQTSSCPGIPFNWIVTANPEVKITSAATGGACSGSPLGYTITSNIPSATFIWSRDAVLGISNPAVSNQTSSTINESLINTGTSAIVVSYTIIPTAFGCTGDSFTYVVKVNPQPAQPVANANTPVCINSTIHLRTQKISGATYSWTGPNGFTSSLQNPDIDKVTLAATGEYDLYVTVNNCTSPVARAQVVVDDFPVASAGPDQLVCITDPFIQLAGSISGGTTTGVWSVKGSDNLANFKPSFNDLNAQYFPTDQDRAAGAVTFILSSTSKDDCSIATSEVTVKFGKTPGTDAGPDQSVCSQETMIKLAGKLLIPGGGKWTTSGGGTFNPPSADVTDAYYIPGGDDVKNGSVKLSLTANDPGQCYEATDDMTIKFIPPPTVNAGGLRYVLKGKTITLNPIISDDTVQYLWTPNIGLSNNKIKNPEVTGIADIIYTLTVTDSRGCVSQDQTAVKVSPVLTVPNTFTPNGDGYNDIWEIRGLVAYENAVIDIFNRYGQKVYHSIGYGVPWDGNYNGQALPPGTYYYIIDTKMNNQVFSGAVTIIR